MYKSKKKIKMLSYAIQKNNNLVRNNTCILYLPAENIINYRHSFLSRKKKRKFKQIAKKKD